MFFYHRMAIFVINARRNGIFFSNVGATGACCSNGRVDALTKVVYAGN